MLKRNKNTTSGDIKKLHETMFPPKGLHTVSEFVELYSVERLKRIEALITNEKMEFFDNGQGDYDSTFHASNEDYYAEVTL